MRRVLRSDSVVEKNKIVEWPVKRLMRAAREKSWKGL